MAFCQNCGSPLAAGSSFCTRCGAPAAGASAPHGIPPQPPYHPAAAGPAHGAPPPKGAGLGKILLIVGGIFLFIALLVVGGLFYAAYKVKQKVESIAGIPPAAAARARRASDPCALLPAAEAARITGFRIEHAESRHDDCIYIGSGGRAAEEGQARADEAMRKLRADEPKSDQEAVRTLEDLTKGLIASRAQGQAGEVLKITVKYGDEARQEEAAIRVVLGFAKTQAPPGSLDTTLQGVGDRGYVLPGAVGVAMAKGDAYVMIESPNAPGRDVLIAVAKAIAGRS